MRMSSMPWQPMQARGEQRASASAPATKMSMQTTQRGEASAPATKYSYATTRLGSVAPPPPGPMNWGLALGWASVVAAAVGIFWGVTQDSPWSATTVRRNNRRRSSRLRANGRKRRRVSRNAPKAESRRRNVAPRMWDTGSDPDVVFRIARVEGGSDAMHAMRQYPGIGVTELLRVLWKSGEYDPETTASTIHTFGSKSLQDAWKRGYDEGARNAHADPVSRAWSKARGPVRKSRIKRNSKRGTKRRVSAVMKAAAGLSVVRDLGITGAPAASKLGQRRYNLLVRRGAGLYRISAGRTPSVIKFKTASPQGAITNTRIASSRSGEAHWLVKVYGEGRPRAVVIRHIGGDGKTRFRVEEYAAQAYERAVGYTRRAG